MAKKDGETRLEDTLDFMKANGARPLALKIELALNTDQRKTDAGEAIKMDYWIKTDSDRARQAIMLCRYVFVEKSLCVRRKKVPWRDYAMGRSGDGQQTEHANFLASQEQSRDHGRCQSL